MPEFYEEPKGLIDELEMHQHAITNAAILREYHQDLVVSEFLSGLGPTLRSQVWNQILRDSIPTLIATFSRIMRVFTGLNVSSAPSIEQFAMIFGRGRGRGRGLDFGERGREIVGRGGGYYGGRQSASEKSLRQYRH